MSCTFECICAMCTPSGRNAKQGQRNDQGRFADRRATSRRLHAPLRPTPALPHRPLLPAPALTCCSRLLRGAHEARACDRAAHRRRGIRGGESPRDPRVRACLREDLPGRRHAHPPCAASDGRAVEARCDLPRAMKIAVVAIDFDRNGGQELQSLPIFDSNTLCFTMDLVRSVSIT